MSKLIQDYLDKGVVGVPFKDLKDFNKLTEMYGKGFCLEGASGYSIYARRRKFKTLIDLRVALQEDEKTLGDIATSFSSRFMPNVKFKFCDDFKLLEEHNIPSKWKYGNVSSSGDKICMFTNRFDAFDTWREREVSIYEAIPELVPEGMRYSKELDKLVPDVLEKNTKDLGIFSFKLENFGIELSDESKDSMLDVKCSLGGQKNSSCSSHHFFENSDGKSSFQESCTKICDGIRDMLIEKNKAYGDSALDPVRIFSSSDSIEQINVRIDDKLSRLKRGNEYPGDDTIDDLIGYLVLLKIAKETK